MKRKIEIRKGQAPPELTREEFAKRFAQSYFDPAFDAVRPELARVEEIAWDAYSEGRKAPRTVKAGAEFENPDYDLSIQWVETRNKLIEAEKRQKDPASPSRVLLVCGSSRNDGTCPGEISKTFRLTRLAEEVMSKAGIETDLL